MRLGVEDAVQSSVVVGRSLEKPEIGNILWIEPRFDVCKVAAVQFEPWAQRSHEADDRCREPDPNLFR